MNLPAWNNDPRIDKMRSGTAEDPYIYLQEPHKIVNQKIILQEYPDEGQKVVIDNFVETKLTSPTIGQFYCDYLNGILFFNSSNEGQSIIANYYGKGISFLASSRIWLEQNNGEVTKTLEDLIIEVTTNNTTFNDNENTRLENEILRQSNEDARQIQEDTRQNTYNTSLMIWKNPVASYDQISSVYPSPSLGWCVQCLNTNNNYRYNSVNATWELYSNFNIAGALLKGGDTMTGDLKISPDKGIVFGNFKIKNNVSLGTIDIELI